MEIFPSEEAQAKIAPSSWGAQATELTRKRQFLLREESIKTRKNVPEAVCLLFS